MKQQRKKLGLVMDWIGGGYQQKLLEGATEWCRHHEVDLFTFVTGRIGSELESEHCRNFVFSLIHRIPLDGLLMSAASISNLAGTGALQALLADFTHKPLVTLAAELDPWPAVLSDNKRGMVQLLDHLVDVHGYQNFAFIRGPRNNPEAQERWEAFCDYCLEHGLPIHDHLIFQGDFRYHSGREAGLELNKFQGSFDVVLASNDLMAAGVLSTLDHQVPIVGYDNSDTAKKLGLTSVDPHPESLAALGCSLVLQGGTFEGIEPSLILRKSCGCHRSGFNQDQPSDFNQELWLERTTDLGERLIGNRNPQDLEASLQAYLPGESIAFWKIHTLLDHPDPELGTRFPQIDPLIPPEWYHRDQSLSVMIQALFTSPELHGFALVDMSARDWVQLEWLRSQISIVLNSWKEKLQGTRVQNELQEKIDQRLQRERELESVLSQLPLWIIEIDRQSRIRYCNQAAEGILGKELAQLHGRELLPFINPEDQGYFASFVESVMYQDLAAPVRPRAGEFHFVLGQQKIAVLCQAQVLMGQQRHYHGGGALSFEGGIRLTGFNLKPVLDAALQPEDIFFKHFQFTWREKEVIEGMIRGLDIKDISKALSISENTVKGYMHSVYIKTGVNNKKQFFKVLHEYQSAHLGHKSFFQSLLSNLMRE